MDGRRDSAPAKLPATANDAALLDHRLRRLALLVGWMVVVAGVLWGASLVWPLVAWVGGCLQPFAVGLVIAYIFHPIVMVAQKRLHVGRIGGIFAVGLLILCLVTLFFGLLVPVLWTQALAVAEGVSDTAPRVLQWIERLAKSPQALEYERRLREWVLGLDVDVASLAQQALGSAPRLTQGGAQALGGALAAVGGAVSRIGSIGASAALVLVIVFYMLADFDAIPRLLRQALPEHYEERIMAILAKVDRSLAGYMRGQLLDCALIGLLTAVGLSFLGMARYAVLVGVLAGLANLIPYLGPVAGATPAVLWALLTPAHETWGQRLGSAGLVVLLFVAIQTLDGLVFQPRIVGRSSNLHPLAVIAALVVGGQFGLGGLIVALPLACVVRVLVLELWWHPQAARRRGRPAKGASPAATTPTSGGKP